MGKKIDVTLAFNADTGKAKSQIQELQSLLNKISYSGATASQSSANAKNLREAADAAKDLAYHLNNAYNNKTGKFDLSLFDKSLKSSNQNLTNLSTKLMSAGKTGQDAFVKLAQSISKADQPMFKLSTKMQDFAKTMKNTIKWQLSSSMLHGFMGAIQSAYGYAKSLNASLNDIRIVTGQSADQMAAFAEQANKAAKRLSTTTTDYTKSSLIYYQQGLSDEEVRQRTETTIKMANVAGTTAQTVSDQMTAVWNNFYDGSKSLEYYSDVMVALGAATASSTDEISEGVNKFAAAAKTVGLSYEYATSALATITAKTRESADVVGNALKTIFSRLQGLTLGETLDDGTNLNKYSKALDAVGISIKTTDGQLKDMDTILDELGTKWQILGQDQQMALAQTVAGVRQYSQLIALMNNYDYFKENLGVAYNAEGTLQEQADIYAESWAAAEKRVRASMEGLYQSLIDDKFFIGINNAIADAVSGLDAFIDAAGGLPTILTTIGSIMLSVFANKMPEAFKNLKYNLDVFTKGADKAYQSVVKQMREATKQGYEDYQKSSGSEGINPESSSGYALQAANDLTIARSKLSAVNDQLNSSEQQRYNTELSLIDQQQQEVVGLKQKAEALQEVIETLSNELSSTATFDIENKIFGSVSQTITESLQDTISFFDLIKVDYDDFGRDIQQVGANINERLITALRNGEKGTIDLTDAFSKLTSHLKKLDLSTIDVSNFEDIRYQLLNLFDALPDGIKDVTGLSKEIRNLARAGNANEFVSSYQNLLKVLNQIRVNSKDTFKGLQGLSNTADLKKLYEALQQLPKVQQEAADGQQRINQALEAFQPTHVVQGLEAITAAGSAMTGTVNIINQIKGLFESFTNPDLTGWERFSAILSSIGFMIPSIVSMMKSVGTITKWQSDYAEKILAAKDLELIKEQAIEKVKQEQQVVDTITSSLKKQSIEVTNKVYKNLLASVGLEKSGITIEELKKALEQEGIKLKRNGNNITGEQLIKEKETVNQVLQRLAAEKGITQEKKAQNASNEGAKLSGWQKLLTSPKTLVAIGLAIAALVAVISLVKKESEKAAKAFEESNKAYEEQKTIVDNLKSKLKELSTTIDELKNKGHLTLIEQQELDKAITQQGLLEQQLSMQEKILETRKEIAAQDFGKSLEKKPAWLDTLKEFKFGPNGEVMPVGMSQSELALYLKQKQENTPMFTTRLANAKQDGMGNIERASLLDFWEEISNTANDSIFLNNLDNKDKAFYLEKYKDRTDLDEIAQKYFGQTLADVLESTNNFESDIYVADSTYTNQDVQWMLDNYDSWSKLYKEDVTSHAQEMLDFQQNYMTYYDNLSKEERERGQQILTEMMNLQSFGDKDTLYENANKYYQESSGYQASFLKSLQAKSSEEIVKSFDRNFIDLLNRMGFNEYDYADYLFSNAQTMRENGNVPKGLDIDKLLKQENWKNDYASLIEKGYLKDYKGDIEDLNEILAFLEETLQKISNIPEEFNFASWIQKYKEIENIASSLKNVGDELSADKYASLGEGFEEFFSISSTGVATLIGDVKDLNNAIQERKISELKQDINDNQNTLNTVAKNNPSAFKDFKINLLDKQNPNFDVMTRQDEFNNMLMIGQTLGITQEKEETNEQFLQRLINKYKELEQLIQDENYELLTSSRTIAEFNENAKAVGDTLSDEEKLTAWKVAFTNIVSEAGLAIDEVSKYSKLLQTTMGMSVQEADEASMRYFQLLQGQKTFQSNWDDWDEKKSEGTLSREIYDLQDALKDLVGSSEDLTDVDFGFFLKNWDLIEKAVDGDSDAVNELIKLLNELGYSIPNIEAVANGLVKAQSTFSDRKKIYSGLSAGDTISKDEYNDLLDEQKELFAYAGDDTYLLNAQTDEAQAKFRTAEINRAIKNNQRVQTIANSDALSDFNNRMDYASSWNNQQYWDQNQIRETLKSQAFQDAANALDLVQEKGETAAEYIRRVGQALYNLPDGSQNIGFMTTSIKELSEMLSSAKITVEEYNEAFDSVFKTNVDEEGFDYEEVLRYAEALQSSESAMVETEQEAKKLALINSKMSRGISSLSSNTEKWSKILVKGANTLDNDYIVAMYEAKKAMSDILDVNISTIKDDFVIAANASGLLAEAADGSKESLEKLQGEYRISLVTNLDEDIQNQITPLLETLQTQLDNTDLKIGMSLDEAGLSQVVDAFNALLEAGVLTVQDLEGIFNSFQFSPEVEWEAVPIANANTQKAQYYYRDSMGNYVAWDGQSETASDGYVYVPKINSTKSIYKPTGGISTPKTSSGGGGGGSSKHPEKKNDIDKERYHTIQNQLEDLNAEYDDISKAKDRAFGKDRLDYMDAEIKKTDELIAKQGEYLNEIKSYLPIDKAVMEAYYKDTIGGPDILFDEKGNISNFDAIQDAMYAKYNQMADVYMDDDTNWEIFEKKYEQLEKYIEQYEETYDLLRDEEQKYQDLVNQRIDAQLEKVQYKVEVKLDVSKDEVAVLEYQLDRINDDAFKSLDAIGLLFDKSMNLEKQIEINKQGLNDALGLSLSLAEISEVMAGNLSVLDGKNFTSDQIDAIKEYRDNLLDLNEQLDDVRENIEEKVLDAFDAWNEKLNTGVEVLDNYGSMLEHFKNMIDIVGQDTLGLDEDFMSNLGQGTVDNAINKVRATKDIMESVMKAQEQAQKSLDEARANGDQKSQEMWEDTLKQLDEEARSAQDTFLQAWEDALSGLADQFEQTVDRVVKNFSKSVYQVGGLEGLANDFSQQKDDSDMMLDDYQKIYELSKLSRDINKTIDDTDVISGKQKLKKLLEQVNDLQADGVEMSQYDLEYLQKTYDLRLAELELEEAQRAKNTVRLQKDNEGNWSYIYTQSSDAIDSAQQKYEDALYAMQDLSSNYIDEMSEKLINTSQEMADALAALRVEDFASLDDYYKEVERVQNLYQDRMAAQEEELNKAIANNKELYDTDWMNYHNATGYKISDTENFATAFKDTLLGALMDSDTDSSNFTELLGQSVQNLTAGLLGAAETYYKNLEEAMNAAGTSTSGFGEDVNEAIDQITAKSDEGAQAVEDMAERMNTAMNDVMSTVEEWQQIYGQAMEEIIQSNLEVIESFNEMIKALGADASNIKINYDITRGSSGAERFATGGYTGEWGSSGKLGILDEKELILNQSDTANMLSAIQLTREIINAIDIGANYASLGFGNLVASSLRDSSRETLEQNVHITAEFPNVNDHNEIELALKNLTNTASQYANRK